jgi:YfiH family protein
MAMLTHAALEQLPGLRHGFLDRRTGRNGGGWTLAGPGGTATPVTVPNQIHGTRVLTARPGAGRPEADGLVTVTPGHLVGVVTADCVPVLLIDPSHRTAAAVHAGWRGAAAGVLEAALEHMENTCQTRRDDLEAVIGPAIGGCCFEVGPEVIEAFRTRTADVTAPAWLPQPGRWHVDLRVAVRLLLAASGVRATVLGPCTACDALYHSYRRDRANAGRQLSFVGWA